MASKMTLNFDVKVIVMSFISNRHDLLSFMQSSHTLYNAGVPYLLQFPNIIKQRQISSFCDFMLSGGSSQLQALRQVSFPSSWVRYRVSSRSGIILRLVQVFNHAHFIKSLEIVECEELLRTHADVTLAIISMKSLERLIISNVGDLTRNMLHRLKSPITHLDMSFFSTLSPPSHLDVTRANPVPVVANLASSLKDITFHRVHLDNRTTRFPNVKTLSMRISHGINAGCMTYTFPNLERLSFDSWPGSQDISDHVAQANHRMNKRTQYGNEWSYLEYLEGNLLDLYFLALNCRIGEVVVTEVTSARLSMLRDVLDDALPRRLNITLSTNSFNPKNLPVLITSRSRVKLTHFLITIILSYSSANPREVLDGLHKLMKRLPIVSTRICLYWKEVKVNGVFRRDPNRHGTHQSVIPPIEANLKQLNVKGVAQNLIVAAPSLRRINLAVSGQDETFWKVTSDKLLVQYLNFNGWEGDEQEPLPSIPIL